MHIAIIGNGISGITTARFIRKWSNYRISVISSESDYFFSRTALMYVYMGHLRMQDTQPYPPDFWSNNRIELIRAQATGLDHAEKKILLNDGRTISYDKLVIATGSVPNFFNWPGQNLEGVRGFYSLQDLDYIEKYSTGLKRAVITGGGLIGVELAEMFHSRNIPVTMLVREKSYWDNVLPAEESAMVSRHIRENGIDLRTETSLDSILDHGQGQVGAVRTDAGETITCGFVGITTGVRPNIDWLGQKGPETDRGILVDDFLQTSIPDVYAIGDCAQLRSPQSDRKAIEAIWYSGRMMGETLAWNLCKETLPYQPGIWFNSAKFFHIEYQVYGQVLPILPPDQDTLYWEHPDGQKSIRINFNKHDRAVTGFQAMGIRLRQEVCQKWLQHKIPIDEVLPDLTLANFDPEFYRRYEQEIVAQYNRKFQKNISLKPHRKLLNKVYQFLKS